MLKVIVTGAYSTGKSSLVSALHEALTASGRTVVTVPDVARNCPVPLNTDQDASATLWLITTQISREIEAALGTQDVTLCDRGVPDVLAHDLDLADGGGWITSLQPFLDGWMSTYDLILLSRVDERIPVAPDGVRIEDASYRTRLDRCARSVLEGSAHVVELPLGDAERLAYALERVSEALDGTLITSTM